MVKRVVEKLNIHHGHKAFIVFGDNITDSFIHPDLTETNVYGVLERFLFQNDFENVVFYDTNYTIKEKRKKGTKETPKENKQENQEPKKKRVKLRDKVGREGMPPLDSSIIVPKEKVVEVETTDSKYVDWSFALDKLNAVMMKRETKSAIIFSDAHNMQNHGAFEPKFHAKFHDWMVNSSNGSIVIFVYTNDNIENAAMPDYMRNHIKTGDVQTLKVGGVGREEIERLINRKRLIDGLKIDWKIYKNTIKLLGDMSEANDGRLIQWKSKSLFGGVSVLDKNTIKKWKESYHNSDSKINFNSIGKKTIEFLDKSIDNFDIEEVKKNLSLVRCQEDNIEQILESLDSWYMGRKEKPLTILLNGTSGTGKTFTAEKLGESMEQYGYRYYYKAMTEFKSDADLTKIIGSSTGYIGSDVRPEIFSKLKEANNKLVICFDEIDKAYEGITESLMQLFEKGYLMWNNERGDFTKCIIVLTSNAAMNDLVKLKERYIKDKRDIKSGDFTKDMNEILDKAKFPSYIMGRMKKAVVYNTLSPQAILDITTQETNKFLDDLREGLKVVNYNQEFLEKVLKECIGSVLGARIIQNTIGSLLNRNNCITNYIKLNKNVKNVDLVKVDESYTIVESNGKILESYEELKFNVIKKYEKDKKKLGRINRQKMEETLSVIKCQEDNITQIIKVTRSWFQNPLEPLNIFLAGTSGTGKSFTAEKLAEAMGDYGYKYFFQAINECQEEADASNIFGTPVGYKGSENKPRLFEELENAKGKLVICFDEVEKAYDGFYNRIMSMMQFGTMDWAHGSGDFSKCIIIMTSNVAMERLVDLKHRYVRQKIDTKDNMEFNTELNSVLNENDIPTFITGRLKLSLIYNPLHNSAVFDIAVQEINKLASKKKLKVKYISPRILSDLMIECEGSVEGARKIQRAIEVKLGEKLTDFVEANENIKEIIIE